MSVSGDDEDDLPAIEDDLVIVEESENVVFVEENNQQDGSNEDQDPDEDAEQEADKKEIKTKRVRNPQPKLDAERLKRPRGLTMLANVFEKVKFKGRGYEEQDLSMLMKNYEYWCHRLFPKLPFDDCLERIERLGSKKPVQTYLKKIRMDLLLEEDNTEPNIDEENNVDNTESVENTERSDFDDLLPQRSQPSSNTQGDGLTDEQLERIRINRERAQRLRQQMIIRNREKAEMELMNKSLSNDLNLNPETEATELLQGSSVNGILDQIDLVEPMSANSETFTDKPEVMSTSSQSCSENMSISLEPVASQMSVSEQSQQQTSVAYEPVQQLSNGKMSIGSSQDFLSENTPTNEDFVQSMSLDLDQRDDLEPVQSLLSQPSSNVAIVDNGESSSDNSEVEKEDNLDKEVFMDVDNS